MANGQIESLSPLVARPSRAGYIDALLAAGASEEKANEAWHILSGSDLYESKDYVIQLIKGGHDHLAGALATFTLVVSRKDGNPVDDWRDLQEIKNRMVGREVEAVELFPAVSRSTDFCNRTVLFCYVGGGGPTDVPPRLPFGAPQGFVANQSVVPHCQQRARAVNQTS